MTSGIEEGRPAGKVLRAGFSRRMLVSGLMGFSCGLPLLLTYGVLQAWMKDEGIDLGTIGLFTLVHLPYTLKFLWAPVFDRFTLPFLGRRRGWLLVSQVLLMAAIYVLGRSQPGIAPWTVAAAALAVTFLSATQDIIVDAYRREDLAEEELGLGSSFYVGGYRLGILLSSGGGLILSDHLPFSMVYQIMAAGMLVGLVTTLLTPEPTLPAGTPVRLKEAVVDPFLEYFRRRHAVYMLLFILLYKLGDQMASAMAIPFFLDLDFTRTEIGAIYKLFGVPVTIAGSFLGGALILRLGIYRSLWVFGFLQMISTAGFAILSLIEPSRVALTVVILVENLSSGLGIAAFMAFMAALTDKRFTATQYALLTSLLGIPRAIASAPTGYMAGALGWGWFFVFCTLIAIPGLLILAKFAPWVRKDEAPR